MLKKSGQYVIRVSRQNNFRLAEPLCLVAYEQMKLHMTGIEAELGLRGPENGHYPKVVYEQPAYIERGISGNCPIAESAARKIRGLF